MPTNVDAACQSCGVKASYAPSAVRLVFYTHGVQTLELFCRSCYEFNQFNLDDVASQALSEMGLPCFLVVTPAELAEHPSARVPVIEEVDVAVFARTSEEYLDRAFRTELAYLLQEP